MKNKEINLYQQRKCHCSIGSPLVYNRPVDEVSIDIALLNRIVGSSFYNELRTQKQLGYVASFNDLIVE